jgi:hypothetical protein
MTLKCDSISDATPSVDNIILDKTETDLEFGEKQKEKEKLNL